MFVFLFSFLFQRLRKFLGQLSSRKGVSAKKLLAVFIWIVQPLPRTDVTLAGSSSESSLLVITPGKRKMHHQNSEHMVSHRLLARTTMADARWGVLGDHRPWMGRSLRVGLAEQPPVGATTLARARTEQREWQRGDAESLGKTCNHVIRCWL